RQDAHPVSRPRLLDRHLEIRAVAWRHRAEHVPERAAYDLPRAIERLDQEPYALRREARAVVDVARGHRAAPPDHRLRFHAEVVFDTLDRVALRGDLSG